MALVPWLMAVGFAIVAKMAEDRPSERRRRSIELCMANSAALWLVEDGVTRVWAERIDLECHRICVECTAVPAGLPGEIDGHPVRIRINEEMGREEFPEEKAARLMAQVAAKARYDLRPIRTEEGRLEVVVSAPEHRRATLVVEGGELSPELRTQVTWISELNRVTPVVRYDPGMAAIGRGPSWKISFEHREQVTPVTPM